MKKLVDLYGYFAQRECPYYIEDSWIGRVLVKEDGTLEGIATDYDRVRKFFLFGTINEKNIRIIRTTINDREIPKMYKAKKENSFYEGTCFVKTEFLQLPTGECKVKAYSADKTREVTAEEIQNVEKTIESFKTMLSSEDKRLYDLEHSKSNEKEKIKK